MCSSKRSLIVLSPVLKSDGNRYYYEGSKGNERKVRTEYPDGKKLFFEGDKDHEHVVQGEYPDGKKFFCEGGKDHEHVVRVEFQNGIVLYFEGDMGHERMVRTEFPNGHVLFFEGDKGHERKVRASVSTSTTDHDAYKCAVCLENKMPTLTLLLPCCHTLCGDCAAEYENQKCPHCRMMACGKTRVFV